MRQKCVECKKPATTNMQKLWVKWKYDAEKGYSSKHELIPDIEPFEHENLHICDECIRLWDQGEI